jgi:hypothetical protein
VAEPRYALEGVLFQRRFGLLLPRACYGAIGSKGSLSNYFPELR